MTIKGMIMNNETTWVESSAHKEIPVNLGGESCHSNKICFEVISSSIDLVIAKDTPCLI